MPGSEVETLRRLGQTVRLARLRRDLSQAKLAERMGVARPTVAALEKGHPGVGIDPLLKAMSVMGYTGRLGDLLAADPIGDELAAARLPRATWPCSSAPAPIWERQAEGEAQAREGGLDRQIPGLERQVRRSTQKASRGARALPTRLFPVE